MSVWQKAGEEIARLEAENARLRAVEAKAGELAEEITSMREGYGSSTFTEKWAHMERLGRELAKLIGKGE